MQKRKTATWYRNRILNMRITKPHTARWFAGRLKISVSYTHELLRELRAEGLVDRSYRSEERIHLYANSFLRSKS